MWQSPGYSFLPTKQGKESKDSLPAAINSLKMNGVALNKTNYYICIKNYLL